jgi:hypothetical protein
MIYICAMMLAALMGFTSALVVRGISGDILALVQGFFWGWYAWRITR